VVRNGHSVKPSFSDKRGKKKGWGLPIRRQIEEVEQGEKQKKKIALVTRPSTHANLHRVGTRLSCARKETPKGGENSLSPKPQSCGLGIPDGLQNDKDQTIQQATPFATLEKPSKKRKKEGGTASNRKTKHNEQDKKTRHSFKGSHSRPGFGNDRRKRGKNVI